MISVYCDGSSGAGGGKPGGWAWVIVHNGKPVATDLGGSPSTTNNIMELTGAVEGLKALLEFRNRGDLQADAIELLSDSQYTLGCASGEWNPTKNLDLVNELLALVKFLKPQLRWVRGHTGDTWNERCDSLAHRAKLAEKRKISEQSPK